MPEHIVHRPPEYRSLCRRQRLAGRSDHDDLGTAPLCLVDDCGSGAPGPHEAVEHPDAVRVTDRDRLVELIVGRVLELGEIVVERSGEWHLEDVERHDPGAALDSEAARHVERVVRRLPGYNGNEKSAVLGTSRWTWGMDA